VAVLYRGQIIGELGSGASRETAGLLMAGVTSPERAVAS
jgi:hypothetical protein